MRGHSSGRTSPNVVSPSSPQKLNNSFESNSSADYSNPNSVGSVPSIEPPKIYLNDNVAEQRSFMNTSKENLDGNRQCALDNKVFAEHFNLDDLSASFRSLYKSVFDQSLSTVSSQSSTSNSSVNSSGGIKGKYCLCVRLIFQK